MKKARRRVHQIVTERIQMILLFALPALSLVMHINVLPQEIQGIHAWRQCETASNINNFAEENHSILDPHVNSLEWENGLKRMEFPILQFTLAQYEKVFGDHILIVRFHIWLLAMLGVIGMYWLLFRIWKDERMALAGAWAFHFSPVFFYYMVNPLPDILALTAGIWGLAAFVSGYQHGKWRDYLLSAGFLMLATLAKLPFVLFYLVPATYLLANLMRTRFAKLQFQIKIALPYLVSIVPPAAWYLWVIPTWHGNGVVKGIFESSAEDIPELLNILWGNLSSTLPELLLNYGAVAFFLAGLYFMFRNKVRKHALYLPFLVWGLGICAYFLFEINMITTVHDYYLLPFLPGLFLIVAYGARGLYRLESHPAKVFVLFALAILPITAAIRTYPRWFKGNQDLSELIAHRAELREAVPDDARVIVGHDRSPHIFLYHLHKKGWSFAYDNVDAEKFARCVEMGAQYLYSSHRGFDGHPVVMPYLGEQLLEVGDFRVYRLVGE